MCRTMYSYHIFPITVKQLMTHNDVYAINFDRENKKLNRNAYNALRRRLL